jgi:putative ABC transport system substrate-binding protein
MPPDAEREVENFARNPGGGMIVVPSALTIAQRATIVGLAARHHLPVAGGGLASYSAETTEISRNVAHYADRILKGDRPADLPVQAIDLYLYASGGPIAKILVFSIYCDHRVLPAQVHRWLIGHQRICGPAAFQRSSA